MIVFDPCYLGLVLSLRDVEFSSGSRCPEVPLNSFALKFLVSRGRFRFFASVRFVSSFLLLRSDRALGLQVFVWIVLPRRLRCPEVGLGFSLPFGAVGCWFSLWPRTFGGRRTS